MIGLIVKLDNHTNHNNPNTKWVRFFGTPFGINYNYHVTSIMFKKVENFNLQVTVFWHQVAIGSKREQVLANFKFESMNR